MYKKNLKPKKILKNQSYCCYCKLKINQIKHCKNTSRVYVTLFYEPSSFMCLFYLLYCFYILTQYYLVVGFILFAIRNAVISSDVVIDVNWMVSPFCINFKDAVFPVTAIIGLRRY